MTLFRQAGLPLALGCFCALSLAQGCKKSSTTTTVELDPPTLEFLGAENEAGDAFEVGETVTLGCGSWLTVHVGPEGEVSGTIDNWFLRPPGSCGTQSQCGYLRVEALDASGDVLIHVEQAVASPLLDLSEVELGDVAQLRAVLLDSTGAEFLDEEMLVETSWDIELDVAPECDPLVNSGGAGGAGGAPSIDSTAGAGGLGGSTDE